MSSERMKRIEEIKQTIFLKEQEDYLSNDDWNYIRNLQAEMQELLDAEMDECF